MEAPPINQDQMETLLEWLDAITFSRPKKNIIRDFADGVLVAQIVKIYFPEMVQMHNYPTVSARNARFANWKTLNDKVFRKLKFQIHPNDITGIINSSPGCIQRVLFMIFSKVRKQQQDFGKEDYSIQGKNNVMAGESKINSHISEQLAIKEETIQELRSTIEIMETKMKRMEELNRLKDAKIDSLIRKLEEGIQ